MWRRAGAPGAGAAAPARSRRRDAQPPFFRGGGSLSRRVLGGRRSLRLAVCAVASSLGAVDVTRRQRRHCLWRSRRRCLRRRAGALGTGSVVPPRSRQRGAWPPSFVAAALSFGAVHTGMVLKTRHRASRQRLSLARIVQIRDTASIRDRHGTNEHANYFFEKKWILRYFLRFPVTSEHQK